MNFTNKKTIYDKIVDWFDVRFGFAKTPLKPIPVFVLNPIYWLGLLLAVTFGLQAFTGIFQLLYYVPNPAGAYSSTMFIVNNVPLGNLVETMHLYTAYAMILLTFLHLMRNYFGSSHKERRELMWVAGIILMLVVLGFGFTGYLLPWTVISKSATDVAVGFANFIPGDLGNLARFLIAGNGSDEALLTRFVAIHTVILPGILIILLALKIYMYEVHGPSYVAAYGKAKPGGLLPWFPKIFLYFTMLVSIYIAALVAVSALVPYVFPPEFNPAIAGNYVVQPDWYLLWVYQILKFQVFEGANAAYALAAVVVFLVLLLLLPLYDRSRRRDVSARPLFVTIGAIILAEFIALTVWGYLTPGQIIPDYQAVIVVGGLAAVVSLVSLLIFRWHKSRGALASTSSKGISDSKLKLPANLRRRGNDLIHDLKNRFTAVFVVVLAFSSVTLALWVNMLPVAAMNLPFFLMMTIALLFFVYAMCWMIREVTLAYEKRVDVH